MEADSLRYDCAYAAAMLMYERFLPQPGIPDALILGQLVFIILEAMNEFERRQGGIAMAASRFAPHGGGTFPARGPKELRVFCPRCLRRFKIRAAHQDRPCLCPGCGQAMRTPDVTGRN